MLKKLLICILLVSLLCCAFVSCKDAQSGGNTDTSAGTNTKPEGEVQKPSEDEESYVSVVYPQGSFDSLIAEEIWTSVLYSFDGLTRLGTDAEAECEREIVIGNTTRRISATANALLEAERDTRDCEYPMFLIYSDGKSLACIYDDNDEAKEMLLEYVLDNYVAQNLYKLESGVVYCNDIISYQDEKDRAVVDDAWAVVEEKLGGEIAKELKALYSLYTNDLISWFANLYEPSVCVCDGECQKTQYCGGGGYYYSNSGRNTPGYLPDIESTHQALGWISASGMTGGYHYNTVIPEWMEAQIVRFIKARQDPNGYFYHPQWSKDAIDNNTSRRTRDLSWALAILEGFGVSPTYDINGVEGDGILYDGTPISDTVTASFVHLTERLGASGISSVSKVVTVNSTLPSYLVDADGMRKYLRGLDITERSYHIGNELAAVAEEITWRDPQLAAEGKETLAPVLISWLNSKQNPENGLWSNVTDYYAVNGFFKITFVYNGLGYPIPYIEKGLSASIDAIMSDEDPGAVTDVYNTWYNVLNVIENIENCYSAGNESVDIALEVLYSKAGSAIKKTTEKLSLFLKQDGSFSYNQNYTSATSQGMPVAVPGTNEGDINATVIATTGTANRILRVLGLDDSQRIPMYTRADLLRYMLILDDLGPVIKDEEPIAEKITFTDDAIGALPEDVECEKSSSEFTGEYYPANGGYEVVYDTDKTSKRGKILKVESVKGIYNAIKVDIAGKAFKGQCYTFQADMCVPNSSADYAIRLRMDDCYAIAFKVYDGKVNLWDVSTTGTVIEQTDLDIAIALGEWFNLKVEYYPGEHGEVRIKTYINDVLMAVSDNYYDQYGKKITEGKGNPSSTYSYVSLSTMTALNTTILIDNILCQKSSKAYEPYLDVDNPLTVNVDALDPGEKVYDFEDCTEENKFPEGFKVSGNGVTVEGDSDKSLNINTLGSSAVIEIPANNRVYGANCFVAEMNITTSALSSGSKMRLEFVGRKDNSVNLAVFDLVVIEWGGEKYLAVADAHEGVTSTVLHTLRIPQNKESKLTIEHYDDENITVIYLDGEPITASAVAVKGNQKPGFGVLRISTLGSGMSDISLDNIKIESIEKTLNIELYDNEKIFDFDTSAYDEVVMDCAGLTGGANKAVMLNSGSVKFPVTVRSPLVTLTRFSTLAAFGANADYIVALSDKEENIVAALYLSVNNGTLSVYELTESGKAGVALVTADISSSIDLTVDWYKNERLLAVRVNDKLLALTSLYYSQSSVSEWVEYCTISTVSGNGNLVIDDVKLESKNEKFVLPDDFNSANTESGAEKITFETTGSIAMLPSAITYNLGSLGANFRIEQLLRDGKMDRVISMTSNTGGNDAVRIGLTKRVANANCVMFECDMYIDYADSTSWRNMQFWVQTQDGKSSAYMFEIWDATYFSENGGSSNVASGFTGVRTWFTLKVEYYDGGFVIVYVNGEPIYTGDGYRGKADGTSPIPAANIERINLYSYMDFVVTYKLDNISLIQTVKSYEAPEIEGDEDNKLGKVEDVLTFEDGLVNEATDFSSGSVNGTTLKVEEQTDGNHVLVLTTPSSSAQNNILSVSYTKDAKTGANGVAFEIDLNIQYTKSDDYLYIQLRDSSNKEATFVSIQNNSIIVYSANGSYEGGAVKLKSGQMSRVRVEYGDTESGVFLRILVDGAISYENNSYLSRDGRAVASENITKIELSTWRQITAEMDNISLGRELLTLPEIKEPEQEEEIPSVYDFEDGELPSSMTIVTNDTNCQVMENEENGKYLAFSTPENSYGTGFIVPLLSDEEGANCVAFEADMSLNVLTGAGLRFNMQDASGNNNMWFEVQKKEGKLYFWFYTESRCYAVSSESIATNGNDDWFNLRVEYYEGSRDSVRTKVYVDEELIMVTDMFMKNRNCGCSANGSSQTPASASDFSRIRIRNEYGAFSGTLYIDNIKFERIVKECADDDITAPRQ